MTFYTYMMRHHIDSDCPAGDLARDMKRDSEKFPKNRACKFKGWHAVIRDYLKRKGACGACLDTFEECWEEYVTCVKKTSKRS